MRALTSTRHWLRIATAPARPGERREPRDCNPGACTGAGRRQYSEHPVRRDCNRAPPTVAKARIAAVRDRDRDYGWCLFTVPVTCVRGRGGRRGSATDSEKHSCLQAGQAPGDPGMTFPEQSHASMHHDAIEL